MLNMESQLLLDNRRRLWNSKKVPKRTVILIYTIFVTAILTISVLTALFYVKSRFHLPNLQKSNISLNAHAFGNIFSRINCFPENHDSSDVSKEECSTRNCTFDDRTFDFRQVPVCFMSPDIGFEVVARPNDLLRDNHRNILATLLLRPLSVIPIFDPPVALIEDALKKRYEVPFKSSIVDSTATENSASFMFSYTTKPFSFYIIRRSNGAVLFNSSMGGLVFSDRFLQLTTRLPSQQFYGLGEQEHPTLLHNLYYKTHAMFARDQPLGEGLPLYGVHPFYMVLETDGNASGVFLLNSNAMEFSLTPAPGVIIRTIGGILDVHVYTGPSPANVIEQHTEFVGRSFIPPYWALGFHLSRDGYSNMSSVEIAINRTRKYGIPVDALYSDVDHMDQRKDFTLDRVNFAGLPSYLRREKKSNGLHSVIILDPDVTRNATKYYPWDLLNGNDSFVKWPNKTTMLGYVWPHGKVGFPDFFLNRTVATWSYLIKRHSKLLPFDGLWTDMNEPTNFGTNKKKPFNWPKNLPDWSLHCPNSYFEDPPYRTRAASRYDSKSRKARLSDATLCMEAVVDDGKYRMYNTHNIYGHIEAHATLKALQAAYPSRRGFVLSRSTFAGSGAFSAHWLGDSSSKWDHLRHSIITVMEMSFFGIALTGPDICGFNGVATPELCKRWMQTGAFYPFSRNHNSGDCPDQDPGYFGPYVADASREYMRLRYLILPYLYTLFYQAHINGSTVARPLFFEFPTDKTTWAIDRQFMLGSSFLVSPIIDPNVTSVRAYVPNGYWYQWTNGPKSFVDHCHLPAGNFVTFYKDGPVLLQRGGSVVVSQEVNKGKIVSTKITRTLPFHLTVVATCSTKKADGWLFWDDGDSVGTLQSAEYLLIYYSFKSFLSEVVFTGHVQHKSSNVKLGANLAYSSMKFVNFPAEPKSILLNCSAVTSRDHGKCPQTKVSYYAATRVLDITLSTDKNQLFIAQSFSLAILI